jgi:single-strand DNA-binding protein
MGKEYTMAFFNKVVLMGNLTRDPELRYLSSGIAVSNFGIAVNRKYRNSAKELVEDVCFVDCTAWGTPAENFSKYMSKGRPVLVEGRLTMQTWVDKTTNKNRSKLIVTVESFQFLGSKAPNGGGEKAQPENTGFDPESGYDGSDLPDGL